MNGITATIQRTKTLVARIHDEESKRIYLILAPIFGLPEQPFNESGARFMAQGATIDIEDLRGEPDPVINVTIPVTVGLFGDDARRFLAAIESAGRDEDPAPRSKDVL